MQIINKGGAEMGKPKVESLEMKRIFEVYYAMGDTRSLQKVVEQEGISMTTIKRYSSAFNWQKRVEQRDLANKKAMEKRTDEIVVNSKALYRTTIKTLTDQFVKDVESGKIKIRNILDFERIVKLDLELMGANSEAEIVDNIASLTEALKGSGWDNVEDPDKEE